MDKHLKTLAPRHVDTKFIKMDAEVSELTLEKKEMAFQQSFAVANAWLK